MKEYTVVAVFSDGSECEYTVNAESYKKAERIVRMYLLTEYELDNLEYLDTVDEKDIPEIA